MPHSKALQKTALDHLHIRSETSCTTGGNHRRCFVQLDVMGEDAECIDRSHSFVDEFFGRSIHQSCPTAAAAASRKLFTRAIRSEECRVGKACDRTCSSGWSPYH